MRNAALQRGAYCGATLNRENTSREFTTLYYFNRRNFRELRNAKKKK